MLVVQSQNPIRGEWFSDYPDIITKYNRSTNYSNASTDWSIGHRGQVTVKFTSGYVTLPQTGGISQALNIGQNNLSIAFWIRIPDLSSASSGTLIFQQTDGIEISVTLTNSIVLRYKAANVWTTYNFNDTILIPDTWVHFALTWDGTNLSTYINGTKVETKTTSITYSTGGSLVKYGIFSNTGHMSDFRLYDHALSLTEIKNIYYNLCVGFSGENFITPIDWVSNKDSVSLYIDTGVVPNQDTSIEITACALNYENNKFILCGSAGQDYTDNAFEIYSWDNEMDFNYADDSLHISGMPESWSSSGNIIGKTVYYQKGRTCGWYSLDGLCKSVGKNHSLKTFESPNTLYLFASNRTSGILNNITGSGVVIYGCKIWQGESLIRDFIPVYDQISHKAALLDKVNDQLYYAQNGTLSTASWNGQWNRFHSYGDILSITGNFDVQGTGFDHLDWGSEPPCGGKSIDISNLNNYTRGKISFSIETFGTLSGYTNCTFCFWYKKNEQSLQNNNGNFRILLNYRTSDLPTKWVCETQDNGKPTSEGFSYTNWYIDGKESNISNIQDTNWHFYCLSGVDFTGWSEGGSTAGSLLLFNCSSMPFYGEIADVKLFSRKLSDNEIFEIYSPKHEIDNNANVFCKKVLKDSSNGFSLKSNSVLYSQKIFDCNKYERLEYIESLWTQWIDTGTPILNYTKIESQFKVKDLDSEHVYNMLYGNWGTFALGIKIGDGEWTAASGGNTTRDLSSTLRADTSTIYTVEQTPNYVSVNGTKYNLGSGLNPVLSDCTATVLLFCDSDWTSESQNVRVNVPADYGSYKLYYLKIYQQDILVRDFLPARRLSDNVIGLYDLVSNQFFYSKSYSSFNYSLYKDKCLKISQGSLIPNNISYNWGLGTFRSPLKICGYNYSYYEHLYYPVSIYGNSTLGGGTYFVSEDAFAVNGNSNCYIKPGNPYYAFVKLNDSAIELNSEWKLIYGTDKTANSVYRVFTGWYGQAGVYEFTPPTYINKLKALEVVSGDHNQVVLKNNNPVSVTVYWEEYAWTSTGAETDWDGSFTLASGASYTLNSNWQGWDARVEGAEVSFYCQATNWTDSEYEYYQYY